MYTWPMHLHAQVFCPHVQWIEEKSYLDHGHSMQRFSWIVDKKGGLRAGLGYGARGTWVPGPKHFLNQNNVKEGLNFS